MKWDERSYSVKVIGGISPGFAFGASWAFSRGSHMHRTRALSTDYAIDGRITRRLHDQRRRAVCVRLNAGYRLGWQRRNEQWLDIPLRLHFAFSTAVCLSVLDFILRSLGDESIIDALDPSCCQLDWIWIAPSMCFPPSPDPTCHAVSAMQYQPACHVQHDQLSLLRPPSTRFECPAMIHRHVLCPLKLV